MKNLFAVLWASFWSFSIVFGQYEPMAIEGAHWVVFDKDNDSTYHHALIIEGVFDCISLSTTPVPVQGLAGGIYFLNIRSSNHATVQKILIR